MFNYISLIIAFFKDKGSLIISCIVGLFIMALLLSNSTLSLKLKDCNIQKELVLQELKHTKELQEIKQSYANKTIEKNTIQYKDRIVYIDRIKADENKSDCDNAMYLLRANF
jgi:hypothetical protein